MPGAARGRDPEPETETQAMFIQLTAAVVDPDENNRHELAAVLGEFGLSVVAQAGDLDGLEGHLAAAGGGTDAPQVALVNLDPDPTAGLDRLGNLPRRFPQTGFFAMSQVLDPQLLMRSMSLGVREFIPLPMTEDCLRDALARVADGGDAGHRGRVIQVVPTVGGCGSTTVACNLAASLAQAGRRTVLVDLDLVCGTVASAFDLRPQYTIADVMQSADRVDQQLVDNALVTHAKSGLKVLGRPELIEESQRVTQAGCQKLLGLLGRMFDCVVIDSVMSVDPIRSTATAAADVTVMVMQLNVPSARNAERYVASLRRSGVEANKVKILVNRHVKKGWDIEPAEVERALGIEIGWTVPNDFKTAIGAINYGEPAVVRTPRAEMSIALRRLAEHLDAGAARPAAARRRAA